MVVPRNFVSRKTSFNAAAPGSILVAAKSGDGKEQRMKMHADEVDISAGLVRRLIAAQLPQVLLMYDAGDGHHVRPCSREPPRGDQYLGRGENAHHDSMSTCGVR